MNSDSPDSFEARELDGICDQILPISAFAIACTPGCEVCAYYKNLQQPSRIERDPLHVMLIP